MAYNVANNLRIQMPDPIGVDQLKRKNALAEMAAQTDQNRNALYAQQLTQNDARMKADQQAAMLEQVRAWAPGAYERVLSNPAEASAFVAEAQKLGITAPEFDASKATPADVEQIAMHLGLARPKAPDPIEAQSIGGFRVLMQGGKPVPGGVQAPERPQNMEPSKPQLVDVRLPDGTVQKQWVQPGQATGTPVGAPGKPGADENRTFTRADKLRDEFNAASKELITIGDNYAKIQEVAADNSAAGDLSLIFSYMKMLDPNSVVREQEFANAQNAAGVPDRIRAAYNKVISGERLSPNQRADFMKQAQNVYTAQAKRHESTVVKRYTAMAKRWGIDPQDVIGDLGVAIPKPADAAQPAGVPSDIAAILQKHGGK